MTKMVTCPYCRGTVDLADNALFLTGCPHCHKVLPRGGEDWKLAAAEAEVARLGAALVERDGSISNYQAVVNHWFPLLGYDTANEMVYPALGDKRARPAPALTPVSLHRLRAQIAEHQQRHAQRLGPRADADALQREYLTTLAILDAFAQAAQEEKDKA